jgi:DNA-binding transcriptional regulator GbsR (MarR family)
MTEITKHTERRPTAAESFILHWGDMGGQWGMSRSVCQVHALLYLSEKPLTAEDIANHQGMARSNVSTSLKELLAWNLINRVPVKGDRREHFVAETDVWEIARRIAIRRKQHEIDPALMALRNSVALAERENNPEVLKRLKAMTAFTENVEGWYNDMLLLQRPQLETLMKFGSKIIGFLPKLKN